MSAANPGFLKVVVLRLLVLMLAVLAVFLLLTSAEAEPPVATVAHTVAAGENLWEIVGRHTPADSDLRIAIDRVMEINGLTDATIHPGQILQLPTA